MKKITNLISLLFLCQFTFGQAYLNSKSYESFKSADSILQKTLSLNYQNIETLTYRLSGKLFWQGHYSVPKERKTLPNTVNISAFRDSVYIQLDSVLYGKSMYAETGYFSKDSSIIVNSAGEVISKGSDAKKQSNVIIYSPITLLWALLNNMSSMRYLGVDEETDSDVITYLSFNKQISLFINKSTFLIDRAEILQYSSIQGDYLLQYFFRDYKIINNNFNCPHKLVVKEWGDTLQEFTYAYSNIEERHTTNAQFSHKKIAGNLYRISYPTMKHFSYVVDFGNYLGVIETPMSIDYMNLLGDYISENLSNKTIKYAFLTHHHPDHAGGFAFFYKNGATVVTTELCSKYLKELLVCPHRLDKENNIKLTSKGEFDIVNCHDSKKYSTKNISLMAIEFPDNGHTKEFILYYFPKSRILIVGDYFYKSSKIRGSKRADILVKFIETKKIKVDKIYPTWSPVGMKEFCSMEELNESARLYQEK